MFYVPVRASYYFTRYKNNSPNAPSYDPNVGLWTDPTYRVKLLILSKGVLRFDILYSFVRRLDNFQLQQYFKGRQAPAKVL